MGAAGLRGLRVIDIGRDGRHDTVSSSALCVTIQPTNRNTSSDKIPVEEGANLSIVAGV